MTEMKQTLKSIIVAILTFEAKILLKRRNPKIIAITGSVGKTSTKDAIFTVLKDRVHARKSQKSFNSEIGVPLSILGLGNAWNNPFGWMKNILDGFFIACFIRDYPEVLVLEAGVDRPGDMKKLATWLKPDVVVLTRLPDVPVHVEYFATPEEVVAEKMHLVHALKSDGVLVYNNDDEKIRHVMHEVRQQSFGYSRYSPSHFTASHDKVLYDGSTPAGLEFTLSHLDTEVTMLVRASLGVQHTYNYAAAAAVGALFDIDLHESAAALHEHVPPAGRMRLIRGANKTLIVDDTYNSSPVACERALQTLKELRNVHRKIAVLGDMMELGQFSVREHERMGELAATSADVLVTLGVRSRKIAEGALEHGMSEKVILQYDDIERAARELREIIEPGDILLIKASQSIRAEKVVAALMAQPEKAGELLVRQDTMWEKKS